MEADGSRSGIDFGLFGPGSMAWRLHREPALLVGGLRALMVQALHPLAIAAVRDFSQYQRDVWGRYDRTSNYVTTTVFGTTRQAEAIGSRVRAVHRPMRGVDGVTGRPYAADDPVLLLWVHTTLLDSFLAAYRRFVGPLEAAAADRYVAELVRQAELVGLPRASVPASEAANQEFIDGLRPQLRATADAQAALRTVLRPPLPAVRRPFWWLVGQAALSIMPDYAMDLYRLRRPLVGGALTPMVHHGAGWARRHLEPPPVLAEARRKARAAGYRV